MLFTQNSGSQEFGQDWAGWFCFTQQQLASFTKLHTASGLGWEVHKGFTHMSPQSSLQLFWYTWQPCTSLQHECLKVIGLLAIAADFPRNIYSKKSKSKHIAWQLYNITKEAFYCLKLVTRPLQIQGGGEMDLIFRWEARQ